MWNQMLPGLRMTLALTLLTGVLYPGLLTALCQALFPHQANGSLIVRNGQIVGSELIGQDFRKPEYFHGRPSAAGSDGYDASASSGSNLGPTSQKLMDRVKASVSSVRKDEQISSGLPSDMVTASASGLDPHISPATAAVQVARIANARGTSPDNVKQLVEAYTQDRDLGVLGEPRVNVLKLNLALDERYPLRK